MREAEKAKLKMAGADQVDLTVDKHLEALRNVGRWLPCGLGCWLPLMFWKYYGMFLFMITMLFSGSPQTQPVDSFR